MHKRPRRLHQLPRSFSVLRDFVLHLPAPRLPALVRTVAFTQAVVACVKASASAAEPIDTSRQQALDAIFGDARVAESSLRIHMQAAVLKADDRFEFLSTYVLPSDVHSLRVDIDFSPTHPAPILSSTHSSFDATESSGGRMQQTGGQLVSPAIDLVRVAWELGRLPDLRASLDTWKPQNAEQRKTLAAFEMILAIAELDFEAALTAIDRLIEVIAENPIVAAERGPEAVAMWIGKQHAQTDRCPRRNVRRVSFGAAWCNAGIQVRTTGRHSTQRPRQLRHH
jgi:hypothetical protein